MVSRGFALVQIFASLWVCCKFPPYQDTSRHWQGGETTTRDPHTGYNITVVGVDVDDASNYGRWSKSHFETDYIHIMNNGSSLLRLHKDNYLKISMANYQRSHVKPRHLCYSDL